MAYRSLSESLKETFGCKVYKLSLDGGMTCPNRDGTVGTRGCIFCSGAGEFAAAGENVAQQIALAKKRVEQKNPSGRYIAYFQSFTNTYAPVSHLRELFAAAMEPEEVVALAIATRADCLGDEVLDLLEELNRRKPLWVELGLQTIHEKTADYIRRGCDLAAFDRAVAELKRRGITVILHMILGLPDETSEEIFATADYIAHSGADGVKFHLLYVQEGTDLAEEYRAGRVEVLEKEEYIPLLAECVQRMPPDMVIHRLTGDGDKRTLIAPLWSADKKRVLNDIRRYFAENGVEQGAHFTP
ncbi:MAG: TIGR01212 family radical SAM protein [Oscillospiraceae bacterium]|nr:TIGR01212 family radical SAM protein [Oscillospiraceae bacterium]